MASRDILFDSGMVTINNRLASADFRRAPPLLQRIWQPYLDGATSFEEAIREYATEY